MQGHYKDFLASTGLLLCFAAVLLDTVLLLWEYQVGQWLRTSCSGRTSADGTQLGGWLALWCMVD